MLKKFYDISKRTKVELEVTGKRPLKRLSGESFTFVAKTQDGRRLTTMVSKKEYDEAADVPVVE